MHLAADLVVERVVAGQEDRLRAQPPGPLEGMAEWMPYAPRLVGRRRDHAPAARAADDDGLAGQLGAAPHLDRARRTRPCRRAGSCGALHLGAADGSGAGRLVDGRAVERRRARRFTRRSRSRTPHQVTRPRASTTMRPDIFEVPRTRSTNEIGTSTIRPPRRGDPVGHLDLEPVAVGPHRVEVDRLEERRPGRPGSPTVASRTARPSTPRGVPVAPPRQQRRCHDQFGIEPPGT